MAARKKGRDGRAQDKPSDEPVDDGSQLMAVKLDAGQIEESRRELVDWLVKKSQLDEKKKAQVTKINKDIKLAEQEIARLTKQADTGVAYIDRQTDMFPTTGGGGRREGAAAARAAEIEANDAEGAVA